MMSGWDRAALLYRPLMRPIESLLLRRWRRRAVAAIPPSARVLEVGAGPGMNTTFYPAGVRSVITDLSIAMSAVARRTTGGLVVAADVQQLPFRDSAFDASVATLVFCAVPDDRQGLRELRRVVAAGGTCVFLEHMRPESRAGATVADAVEPLTSRLFGEHVNRRTVQNVEREAFKIERVEHALGTLLRLIVARR